MRGICCEEIGYMCGNDCRFNPRSDFFEGHDETEFNDEPELNDIKPFDMNVLNGVFIGIRDIYHKQINEGSTIRFKSKINGQANNSEIFEGVVRYDRATCGFYIDRGFNSNFYFGEDIYDIEIVENNIIQSIIINVEEYKEEQEFEEMFF